jgi:hypothetical protein
VSNWSDPNGVSNWCNGNNEYGYDACRNPWRMATDYIWYGTTVAQTNFCNPIAIYTNNGSRCGGPVPQSGGTGTQNATFVSTFAAAICGASTTYQSTLNSLYTKTVNTTDALPAYFGNTLRVISLFMMTGNFWKPTNLITTDLTILNTLPVLIYPIPCDESIYLDINTKNDVYYTIYGINGNLIDSGISKNNGTNFEVKSPINPGMYLIKLEVDSKINISCFIKN